MALKKQHIPRRNLVQKSLCGIRLLHDVHDEGEQERLIDAALQADECGDAGNICRKCLRVALDYDHDRSRFGIALLADDEEPR